MHSNYVGEAEISSYLKPLLQYSGIATIHSVFRQGFNILYHHQLMYVSQYQNGNLSAVGIQLKVEQFDDLLKALHKDALVKIQNNQWIFYLRPNVLTLNITNDIEKNLTIPSVQLDNIQLDELFELLKTKLDSHSSAFDQIANLISIKEQWFHDLSFDNHQRLIPQLIGHGLGLTPSGDDFLQGIMIMEQALQISNIYQPFIRQTVFHRSTTDVSMAYYQALFNDFVNEPWYILLSNLNAQPIHSLNSIIDRILAYGHTSGSDMLLGCMAYIDYIRHKEE